MGAYSLEYLKVQGINVGTLVDVKMVNKPGDHAVLFIKAEFLKSVEDNLLYGTKSHQSVTLYGQGKVLFKGLLNEIEIEKKNDIRYAIMIIKSYSVLMDLEYKSRSFQDISLTYGDLIRQVLKSYNGSDCYIGFTDRPIGKLMIQYKETDWEFINRILSEIRIPIANDINSDTLRLYFGIPETVTECKCNMISISKNVMELKKVYGTEISGSDIIDYEFNADVCIDLFTAVMNQQKRIVIREVQYNLIKGILECTYVARNSDGIYVPPTYPLFLVGIAVGGKVLQVKDNMVRVHLEIDDDLSNDIYWFPYSSLSASSDGSGWYFMPEPGDFIRIQFPTKYAEDAIVISSISGYMIPKNGVDCMENPSTKYLSNIYGQCLCLGEDGVYITTGSDKSKISVSSLGDISIVATNNVSIIAKENLTLKSEQLKVQSKVKMTFLSQQGGKVELKDNGNIEMAGAEVIIN